MMSYDDFKKQVMDASVNKPKHTSLGQFVFNYIDEVFCVARSVQFIDGVDCFHNDDDIEIFLIRSYQKIREYYAKGKK